VTKKYLSKMDDKLHQDDFEEFLQKQVQNHRMYPSDAVWRKIDKELHGDKNWPALTIAAFAILIATVAVCVHFSPKPNIFAVQPAYNKQKLSEDNNRITSKDNSAPFLNNTKKQYSATNNNWLAAAEPKSNTIADDDVRSVSTNKSTAAEKNELKGLHTFERSIATVSANKSSLLNQHSIAQSSIAQAEPANSLLITTEEVKENNVSPTLSSADHIIKNDSTLKPKQAVVQTKPAKLEFNDKNMVDDFLKDHKDDISLYTTTQTKSVKNKFNYLIYLAPSISYRKLTEDPALAKNDNAGGPVALNYVTDVNNVVRHKPGTGIEAGVSILYNLTGKIRIKSGLQFNMRQYNIEAYRIIGREPTSIALISSRGVDTVNATSGYRTNNGYSSAQLSNRYFQLAVPVGLEWEILGNKKIQWNVAGSIQPTYLLNKNAYLLSANFKNYAESRNMINSWNINSSIETFISFKVGDYKWQLGPQLRYQHLPTFIPKYPIREHLMDYGLKLGVSKVIL